MHVNSKIYVAGHSGMVGSAIIRQLKTEGYSNIITRTHKELDLTRQADAVIYLMNNKDASDIGEFVNVGTGKDLSIKELAVTISEIVGYGGKVNWDTTKPNGTPRKLLDVSRLSDLGWSAKISLKEGIEKTYKWYCENL